MERKFTGRIIRSLGVTLLSVFGLLAMTATARAEGWYAGVGAGTFTYDIVEESATGTKVLLGYGFNKNVAVELSYADLGEGKVSEAGLGSASVAATGYGVSLVGIVPASPNFSVFGKIGYFNWNVEAKATLVGIFSVAGDDSGSDLIYGVGAQYDFSKTFGMRLEWERYDLGDFEEVDAKTLGVVFRF